MPDRSSAQSREPDRPEPAERGKGPGQRREPDGLVLADEAEAVSQAISRVEKAAAEVRQALADAERARERPFWRRILTPLVLVVSGGLLLLATWRVYPWPPAALDNAGPAQLTITTAATVTEVDYVVGAKGEGADVTVIATPTGGPRARAPKVMVHLAPSALHTKAEFLGWYKTVRFSSASGRFSAAAHFPVSPTFASVAYNDLTASAAIPDVTIPGPSTNPVLYADYDIPSGGGYDWSSFPPLTSMPGDVEWQIHLTAAEPSGRMVVGTSPGREDRDSFRNFFAGALVALAFAAFLSAIQETVSRFWS
jgi:hypothetical protein